MLLVSFSKCPGCLPYVLLNACEFHTLVPVDCSTFLVHRVLIFRFNWHFLNGPVPCEVGLYSILAAYLLNAFPQSLHIGYNYMTLTFLSLLVSLPVVLLLGLLVSSSVGYPWVLMFWRLLFKSFLSTLSHAHLGYLHLIRTLLMYFLIKKFWSSANSFGSVLEVAV